MNVEDHNMEQEDYPITEDHRPLHVIVGDRQISPCDHETFARFKLWVARTLTPGSIDTYTRDEVTIEHWDSAAGDAFPHLLNPCECGTYLPMDVPAGPMLSSAISLLAELTQLRQHYDAMAPDFQALMDALLEMAELALDQNIAMEIR